MQWQNPFQRFNWTEIYWQYRCWQLTSVMLFGPSTRPGKADFSSLCKRACWTPQWWAWAYAQSCLAPRLRESSDSSTAFTISVFLCVSNLFSSLFCFALFSFKCSLLVELLKHKPKATDEKLKTVMDNFSAFLQKCCAAADKEACFSEEVLESFLF